MTLKKTNKPQNASPPLPAGSVLLPTAGYVDVQQLKSPKCHPERGHICSWPTQGFLARLLC